jgi:hypothetical protein
MAKRRKQPEIPQVQGPQPGSVPFAARARAVAKAAETVSSGRRKGLWFVVMKHLERNGKAYLPLNHHLVASGQAPDELPSFGAKGKNAGQTTVPADRTGIVDLSEATPAEIWQLFDTGTVVPVEPETCRKILEDGKRQSRTAVTALIPPMRMVNPMQQYEQATRVPLTEHGARNLAFAQQKMPNPFER